MKKYNIVMVTGMGNARATKIAIPLVADGHEVTLITSKPSPYLEVYSSVFLYKTMEQFRHAVTQMDNADIFHVHNEPAWFVSVIKEIWGDKKPVIVDIHDSTVIRGTGKSIDERNNFQIADGIVYVSKSMAPVLAEEYELRQPNIILPTFVPQRFFAQDYTNTYYYGGLIISGGVTIVKNDPFEYINYLDFAKECKSGGVQLNIITPEKSPKILSQYEPFAQLHPPLGLAEYINYTGGFDWGFVGNSGLWSQWVYALPNRFFEYIAAGIPVMAMNANECEHWVNYGLGIIVNDLTEIKENWNQCTAKRKFVLKERFKYSMEANIGELMNLYKGMV